MTAQALCRLCGAPSVLIEDWPPGLGRPFLTAARYCWACISTGKADQ